MKTIHIKYPIWKTRSVGIAEHKIVDDLKIYIDYKTRDGEKLYPGYYFIEKERALTFPVQHWRNVKLRIIPISSMTLKGRKLKKALVQEEVSLHDQKDDVVEEPIQKDLFIIDN